MNARVDWRASANLLGSKTPCFFRTSATIGTVELTGLEITRTKALGAAVAIPVARSRTIPALICPDVSDNIHETIKAWPHLEQVISACDHHDQSLEHISESAWKTYLVIYDFFQSQIVKKGT